MGKKKNQQNRECCKIRTNENMDGIISVESKSLLLPLSLMHQFCTFENKQKINKKTDYSVNSITDERKVS